MPHALAHDACTGSPLARVFGICPRFLCGLSRRSQLYWQWLGPSGWEISCAKCNLPMLAWGRAVFWQSLLIPLTWTLHCSPCWALAGIANVNLGSLGFVKLDRIRIVLKLGLARAESLKVLGAWFLVHELHQQHWLRFWMFAFFFDI